MKAKYIDTKQLLEEIEGREKIHFEDYHIKKTGGPADYGAANALTQIASYIRDNEREEVDLCYLIQWYISCVDSSEPVWTEEHLKELLKDFILIPRKDMPVNTNT